MAEECVAIYDEMDRHRASYDAPRRELVDHICLRLEEILERSGVEIITEDKSFDRGRHQVDGAASAPAAGAAIAETLSPGFCVERRVLRRARVRLEGDA